MVTSVEMKLFAGVVLVNSDHNQRRLIFIFNFYLDFMADLLDQTLYQSHDKEHFISRSFFALNDWFRFNSWLQVEQKICGKNVELCK